jgi:uncharacterized protein
VTRIGRDLIVPVPVAGEVDQLIRARAGAAPARAFLGSLAAGDHLVVYLSPGLLRRAQEIDAMFADLNLGLADASIMALAERDGLPILTFDFRDFRAAHPTRGYWSLVVDESRYHEIVGNA